MASTKGFFGNRKFRLPAGRDPETQRLQYRDAFARVDVSIDLDGIFEELGAKALRNKSGKARGLGGLITVKAKELK
jgi:hypothetical protein